MIAQVAVRRKGTARGLKKMECFQELTLGAGGKQAQLKTQLRLAP